MCSGSAVGSGHGGLGRAAPALVLQSLVLRFHPSDVQFMKNTTGGMAPAQARTGTALSLINSLKRGLVPGASWWWMLNSISWSSWLPLPAPARLMGSGAAGLGCSGHKGSSQTVLEEELQG